MITDTLLLEGYLHNFYCSESQSYVRVFTNDKRLERGYKSLLKNDGAIYIHPQLFLDYCYDSLDSTTYIEGVNHLDKISSKYPIYVVKELIDRTKHQVIQVKDTFVVGLIRTEDYVDSLSHVCKINKIKEYMPVITLYRTHSSSESSE